MAQRKITLEQATAFLNKLGADVEIVGNDATDASFNEDELFGVVDTAREPIITQKVKGGLEADINKSVSGKISSAVRKSLIEATGVDAAAIEGKDTKEATKIAIAHYAKSLGTDKDTAAAQLQEVVANHQKELARVKDEGLTTKQEYEKKIADFGVNQILSGMYATAKGIEPTANKQVLQDDFKLWLERNYDVRISEDSKNILPYKKGTDALALNDAGTQVVVLPELMEKFHTDRGQWKKDNRDVNPAEKLMLKTEPFHVKAGDKVMSPGDQVDAAMMAHLGMK